MSQNDTPSAGRCRYRALEPEEIIATAELLGRRIVERFPGSGLGRVADELAAVCRESRELSAWLARPNLLLRAGVSAVGAVLLVTGVAAVRRIHLRTETPGVAEFLQGLEAGINNLVFLSVAVWFLGGLEKRWKRRRAQASLHTLRSLAHIVDMHQLTKDPERVTGRGRQDTESSPRSLMTPFELVRYLDYCTEMLALVSKAAALHLQHFDDAETRSTVEDIEDLTLGLSQQIWQKIMILDRVLNPAGDHRRDVLEVDSR